MVKKTYSKDGRSCRVRFELPASVTAGTAFLYGDFQDGEVLAIKMEPLKGGGFSVTVSLPAGHSYPFHYQLDGSRWMNDPTDEMFMTDDFGLEESVVKV